ncbi:MAG TPA: PEP-CTERM sorting domain-containing protein [Lacunisphaera sp.]|nr:PEP-CTERM sorting domain-containing protein [Lacunisphaera sp.]
MRIVFMMAFAIWLLVGLAKAQIDTVLIGRRTDYIQGETGGPTLNGSTPYYLFSMVDGNTLTGSELSGAPTISGAANASFPVFDSTSHDWSYTSSGYSSLPNLVSAFPDGDYSISLPGQGTATGITLGSTSVVNAPDLTLSGGTWINSNTYQISTSASLGVMLNNAISVGGSDQFHYDLQFVNSGLNDQNNFASAGSTPTFTDFALGTVAPGTYSLQLNFDDIQDPVNLGNGMIGSLSGLTIAGLFSTRTSLNISVVPEPSTYAVIFGAAALTGVMLRRRRFA